jgi:hypothetical protein
MSPTTGLSYSDILQELDRRAANRQARNAFTLSVVATLIAVAAVIVAMLKH